MVRVNDKMAHNEEGLAKKREKLDHLKHDRTRLEQVGHICTHFMGGQDKKLETTGQKRTGT
jgi:hypothetical protein